MMSNMIFLALLLGSAAASGEVSADDASSVAAVQKVIQMLGDMSAKCKQEKQDEEVAYAEFNTWCSSEKAQLAENIKKGGESIELLTASVDKLGNEAETLGEE